VDKLAIGGVAVLQDVLLDVVEADKPTRTFNVTNKAVEDGANISDHMKEQPTTLSISGLIAGSDAWTRLSRIIRYQRDKQLITYTNRVVHSNMAITKIDTNHGADTANGVEFTIQMRRVRRARPQQAHVTNVPPAVATKAQPGQNAGTQQAQATAKQSNNKESDAKLNNIASGFSGGGAGGGLGSGDMTSLIGA